MIRLLFSVTWSLESTSGAPPSDLLFDSDGREHFRSDRPTPRHLGPEAVVATTIDAIAELRSAGHPRRREYERLAW